MSLEMRLFSFIFALFCASIAMAGDLTIEDRDGAFTVSDRGRAVFTYRYTAAANQEITSGELTPTHYVHPLFGMLGESITADVASAWDSGPGIHWGWNSFGVGRTLLNIERGEGGRRVFERVLGTDDSGDTAAFAIQSSWITDVDGRARVMENLTVTTYPIVDNQRKIDFYVQIRNISEDTVYLQGALPGTGLSLLLDSARSDWAFSSPSGWLSDTSTPYLSPWTVGSYRDDRRSTRSGIAVMQDSRNPGYTSPNWLLEAGPRLTVGVPESYKNGLKPAAALEFRYRILLFRAAGGGPDMTKVFSDFMEAPSAPN